MAEILTQSVQQELLPQEVQERNDLPQRVELAEVRVLDRYREDRRGSLAWYYAGEVSPSASVQLYGYRGAGDGTIDTEASDDELVRRLQLVVASLVKWSVRHDHRAHLDRERKGSKAVSYSDAPVIPTRLFQPLRKFDEREPFIGF